MDGPSQSSVASVASLPPDEVVHEGGGQPTAEPEKPETFKGLDGDIVEKPKPPKATVRTSRKTVEPPPESEEEPEKKATAAPTTDPAPSRLAIPEGAEVRRRQGESDEDFLSRYAREEHARYKKAEERAERVARESAEHVQRLTQMFEPLLERHRQQMLEEQQRRHEEAMAALPDKEAEPDQYRTLLVEETLRRQLALEQKMEAERQQNEEARQRREEEDRHQQYLADRDEGIQRSIQEMIQDPELDNAYKTHIWLTSQQFVTMYPDASDAQLEELTFLAHMQEMIEAGQRGMTPAQFYKQQAELLRQAHGFLSGGNGNGTPRPAPQKTGSPTATAVAKEAQQARAAQALSTGGAPGRAGGLPGQSINPDDFEDDWAYAGHMLNQAKDFSTRWLQQASTKPKGPRR